jgi:AAA family ATP:ADP antiporter
MAAASGAADLPWLFSATFLGMCLVSPLFALAVARFQRRRFLLVVYLASIACLLIFYVLWQSLGIDGRTWLGRVFFVWLSVFNMFVISVFWSVQADRFSTDQGKRLFGSIAVGGTLGTIAGSGLTLTLSGIIGKANLLLLSAGLLGLGLLSALALLGKKHGESNLAGREGQVIGGSVLAGFRRTLHSPYLLAISGYILLMTMGPTLLYMEKIRIGSSVFADNAAERLSFFTQVDLYTQLLTLVMQLFFTGHLIKHLGIGLTLCSLPLLSMIGFGILGAADLGLASVFWVFVAFEVTRQVLQRGLAKPSREVLFTLVTPEDKYKSKNFIDTVVYRGSDLGSVWFLDLARAALGSLAWMCLLMLPFMLCWTGLGLLLGRQQRKLVRAETTQV